VAFPCIASPAAFPQGSRLKERRKDTLFGKANENCILCNADIFIVIHQEKKNGQHFAFNSDPTATFLPLDVVLLPSPFNHYVTSTEKNKHHAVKTLKNFESTDQSSNSEKSTTCKEMLNIVGLSKN